MRKVFRSAAKHLQRERSAHLDFRPDYLRQEVAARIADRLYDVKRDFARLLEYKSGSGYVSMACTDDQFSINPDSYPSTWTRTSARASPAATLASPCLRLPPATLASRPFWLKRRKCCRLSLAPLMLPCLSSPCIGITTWSAHLPKSEIVCRITLNKNILGLEKDGVFVGAILGGDTLFELRSSLQLAQQERLGGIKPHISPMVDFKEVGGLLSRAGIHFRLI